MSTVLKAVEQKKPRITHLYLVNAITGLSGSMGGDTTVNVEKHKGIEMELLPWGGVVVRHLGRTAIVPPGNIKSMLVEEK